jgi:hypothetical protein
MVPDEPERSKLLLRQCGHALPPGKFLRRFFAPLLAWKLAGLPTPEEPVISLLSAGQSPG